MLHKTGARMRANICGLACVVTLGMACGQAQASEISAVGPLEAVDCRSGTVQVLGIKFRSVDSTGLNAVCTAGLPSELSYVAITGATQAGSSPRLVKLSVVSKGQYVPGATPVYVRGEVTTTRISRGEIGLSGATVQGVSGDLSAAAVEVLGTQPLIGGAILAASINTIAPASSDSSFVIDSSTGSGIFSSTASGLLSSTGSGVLSSTGSGTLSSTGSGKLSSTGSGVLSSTGSGIQSSPGSGTLSSTGSGKLSSTGSGKLSSTGSGVLSSTGSGVLSSTGSGTLSSTGSGKLSSTGSGALSSTGSGVLSSTGSGVLSSTGSGTLSSTGSGTLSSTGSGISE